MSFVSSINNNFSGAISNCWSPYGIPVTHAIEALLTALYYPKSNVSLAGSKQFVMPKEVRTDVKLREEYNRGFCVAKGANLSLGAEVVMMPHLEDIDPAAHNFILRHELAHIKNNDLIFRPLVGVITSLAAAIILSRKFSTFFSTMGSIMIGKLSYSLFSRYNENQADQFAISNSSDEELKGGIRFFKAIKKSRKLFPKQNKIRSTCSHLLDIKHPSIQSRINQIQTELWNRNVSYSKQERLKDYRTQEINALVQFNIYILNRSCVPLTLEMWTIIKKYYS